MKDKLIRFCALTRLFLKLMVVYLNPLRRLFLNRIIIDIWKEATKLEQEEVVVPIENLQFDSEDAAEVIISFV